MAKTLQDQVTPILTEVMDNLRDTLRLKFKEQGHRLSGAWEESLTFEIKADAEGVTATMKAAFYGGILEFGVKASRIPYTVGGGRRGGKSLYIQGLIKYWQGRGLSGVESTRAAFATAAKHKREGMPTRASSAFSKTGKRTGFIKETISDSFPDILRIIEARYAAKLELAFGDLLQGLPNITLSER